MTRTVRSRTASGSAPSHAHSIPGTWSGAMETAAMTSRLRTKDTTAMQPEGPSEEHAPRWLTVALVHLGQGRLEARG